MRQRLTRFDPGAYLDGLTGWRLLLAAPFLYVICGVAATVVILGVFAAPLWLVSTYVSGGAAFLILGAFYGGLLVYSILRPGK